MGLNSSSAAPEILAPGGSLEAAYAAFRAGADAVYVGLPRFSARAEAAHLEASQLEELAAYAHSLRPARRVAVAVNTLIQEHELEDVIRHLVQVADAGADAVIVQDLGVARIVREHFPELRLHGSTQLAIHNPEGVEALRDLGFARATLARELTLEEVRECAAVPGIEVEVFIHGALCYSYSGLCLLSSHLLGRSGNRGRCAYLCRDAFRAGDAPESAGSFLFSMKDLALPEAVDSLRQAGVAALKIEGRMKSPLYVAATTTLYRHCVDGTLTEALRQDLEFDIRTLFSRPWTPLYLLGPPDAGVVDTTRVGHRGVRVGAVETVTGGRGQAWLRFRTEASLERHDGLQLEIGSLAAPFGFPVAELRLLEGSAARRVFEAPAGSRVEVLLPAGAPRPAPGDPVYLASSQAVKRRYHGSRPKPGEYRRRLPTRVRVRVDAEGLTVEARTAAGIPGAADVAVCRRWPMASAEARDPEAVRNAVSQAFSALGDTGLSLGDLDIGEAVTRFVPLSILNRCRRETCEALAEGIAARRRERLERVLALHGASPPLAVSLPATPLWSVKTDGPGCLDAFEQEDWANTDEVVLEIDAPGKAVSDEALVALADRCGRERLRLALPLITRSWERAALIARITELRARGWQRWEVGGLGAWGMLRADPRRGPALDLAADWPLHVLNGAAVRALGDMGARRVALSPEDDGRNLRALLTQCGDRALVPVYQDTPLFVSETCVVPCERECGGRHPDGCSATASLFSSHGDALLLVRRGGRTFLLHRRPYCSAPVLPELREAGARHFRVEFMRRHYEAAEALDIWRDLRQGRSVPGRLANLRRGLL